MTACLQSRTTGEVAGPVCVRVVCIGKEVVILDSPGLAGLLLVVQIDGGGGVHCIDRAVLGKSGEGQSN